MSHLNGLNDSIVLETAMFPPWGDEALSKLSDTIQDISVQNCPLWSVAE